MTYEEAMKAAKKGYRVRNPAFMSKGWTIAYLKDADGFFNINPHNGSNYHFTPTKADKESIKWEVA